MKYTVIVTPGAQIELDTAYEWLAQRTQQYAAIWYNGIIDALLTLEEFPGRCPLAPESRKFPSPRGPIRQLLYGDKRNAYRILFCIRGETVRVLHIRHAAQNQLEFDI